MKIFLEKNVDNFLGWAFSDHTMNGFELARLNDERLRDHFGIKKEVDRSLILKKVSRLARDTDHIEKLKHEADTAEEVGFHSSLSEEIHQLTMTTSALLKNERALTRVFQQLKQSILEINNRLAKLETMDVEKEQNSPGGLSQEQSMLLLQEITSIINRKHQDIHVRLLDLEQTSAAQTNRTTMKKFRKEFEVFKKECLMESDAKFDMMKKMLISKTENMELDVEELQQIAAGFEEKQHEMYQQHRFCEKQQNEAMEFMQDQYIQIVKQKEKSVTERSDIKLMEFAEIQEELLKSSRRREEEVQAQLLGYEKRFLELQEEIDDIRNGGTAGKFNQQTRTRSISSTLATIQEKMKEQIEQVRLEHEERLGEMRKELDSRKAPTSPTGGRPAVSRKRREARPRLSPMKTQLGDTPRGDSAFVLEGGEADRVTKCEETLVTLHRKVWALGKAFDVTRQRGAYVDSLAKRMSKAEEECKKANSEIDSVRENLKSNSDALSTMQAEIVDASDKIEGEMESLRGNQTQLEEHAIHLEDSLIRMENIAKESGLLEESEEEEEVSVSHERSQERTEWKETYTKRDQSEPKQLSPESMSSLQIEVTNLKHDVHSLLKSRQHTHDALVGKDFSVLDDLIEQRDEENSNDDSLVVIARKIKSLVVGCQSEMKSLSERVDEIDTNGGKSRTGRLENAQVNFVQRLCALESGLRGQNDQNSKDKSQVMIAVQKVKQNLTGVMETFQQQTVSTDRQISTLRSELTSVDAAVQNLEASLAKENHNLVSRNSSHLGNDDLQTFKADVLSKLQRHIGETSKQVETVRQFAEDMKVSVQSEVSRDVTALKELDSRVEQLEEILQNQVTALKLLKMGTQTDKEQIEQLEKEYVDITASLHNFKTSNSQLKQELETLKETGVGDLTTKVPEDVSDRLEGFDLELQKLRTGQEELGVSVNNFILEARVNMSKIESDVGELKAEPGSDLEPRLLEVEERQQELLIKADEIQTSLEISADMDERIWMLETCHLNVITKNYMLGRVNMIKDILLNTISPSPELIPHEANAVKFHVYIYIDSSAPGGSGWMKFSTRSSEGVILDQSILYYHSGKSTAADSICFWLPWVNSDHNLYIEREEGTKPSVSIYSKVIALGWR